MVRRLPAGPSRRHPRSDAWCGVMNAMLGPTLRDVPAVTHRNEIEDGQTGRGAAGAHWHEIFTEYLSARDPSPR